MFNRIMRTEKDSINWQKTYTFSSGTVYKENVNFVSNWSSTQDLYTLKASVTYIFGH